MCGGGFLVSYLKKNKDSVKFSTLYLKGVIYLLVFYGVNI